MKEGGRGWTEGGTFIIIYVLILNILDILCNILPVFNAYFNEFFRDCGVGGAGGGGTCLPKYF